MSLFIKREYRKGAASFYIVAFSTLILLIIATSFATIIISEMTRTSNEDLSQSAYDSALAGIEDAKIAFYNYKKCLADNENLTAVKPSESVVNCESIAWYMENPDCDMVGHILGRIAPNDTKEVVIQESVDVDNNMQQAYTCVKIQDSLKDYSATLSSTNQIQVIDLNFDNGVQAKDIDKVEVNWYSDKNGKEYRFNNFNTDNGIHFQPIFPNGLAVPPTISVALVQTAEEYEIRDFDVTRGDKTNRGMVYLVPMDDKEIAGKNGDTYFGAYNGSRNYVSKNGFLKSNDKTTENRPYGVYCSGDDSDYACSTTIELPEPVNGDRSNKTFRFVVALPYGGPDTDISLKFSCKDGVEGCKTETIDDDGTETSESYANLKGVQVEIDSTGRANDLYRRVQARLESGGTGSTLSVMGPLELLGNSSGNGHGVLDKNNSSGPVITEWNFR